MKVTLLMILFPVVLLLAADKKAEKLADEHRAAVRKANHIAEQWQAHCKGLDMVPDIQAGCVAKPTPPPAAPPAATPAPEPKKEEPKK